MGRKSNIDRLEPSAKAHLQKLMREGRHTLTELLEVMREKFPEEALSRSGLQRYQANFTEMVGRMREIETAASALVNELGDGVGDKAGALLTQAVTTLATDAALKAHNEDLSVKEIGELARAARATMQARTMSLKERQAIAEEARAKLLEEQRAALEAMPNKGGVTATTKAAIREALGIV